MGKTAKNVAAKRVNCQALSFIKGKMVTRNRKLLLKNMKTVAAEAEAKKKRPAIEEIPCDVHGQETYKNIMMLSLGLIPKPQNLEIVDRIEQMASVVEPKKEVNATCKNMVRKRVGVSKPEEAKHTREQTVSPLTPFVDNKENITVEMNTVIVDLTKGGIMGERDVQVDPYGMCRPYRFNRFLKAKRST